MNQMVSLNSRYILRQIIAYSLPMLAVALIALLLERMLRLLDLFGGFDRVFGYLPLLLVNLVPHYLGLALPASFFLGVLLTFSRMNRERELVVILGTGVGLHQLLVPVMGLSLILTLIATMIFSYLQPYGRHGYRAFAFAVAQSSLRAAVRDGTFIRVEGLTFMAEGVPADSSRLRKVFVYEQKTGDKSFVTTAQDGWLLEPADQPGSILKLQDGQRVAIQSGGGSDTVLRFDDFSWPIGTGVERLFRERGKDERELTLVELWAARDQPPRGVTRAELKAEFHARLVKIFTILLLPVLAVPLAMGGGREGQTFGIVLGLLVLVGYEEALQLGESLTAQGRISPWLGMWAVFSAFALGGSYLFCRASFKVISDPFVGLGDLLAAGTDRVSRFRWRAAR